MRKYTSIILIFLSCFDLNAQCFSSNQIFDKIEYNSVKATLRNQGVSFTELYKPGYIVPYDKDVFRPTHTIGTTGLWIGAKNAAGEKITAVGHYVENNIESDFFHGPIADNGTVDTIACIADWDKIWVVTSRDIFTHIRAFRDNGGINLEPPVSLLKWPGKGNPHSKIENGFALPNRAEGYAPFYDANKDGIYDPIYGDYPTLDVTDCSIPSFMAWCIYNDLGGKHKISKSAKPLGVEVQQFFWGYQTFGTDTLLDRSMFTSYKIIYKGDQPLDSAYVGIWTEYELGCHTDDFHGCDTTANTYYGYNANRKEDKSCITINASREGYGLNPPVQAITFLNKKMHKFIHYDSFDSPSVPDAIYTPKTANQFYNYLTGKWKDGSPLKKGGNGYNLNVGAETDYIFPDDPTNTTGWSMATANFPKTDFEYAVVGSSKWGKIEKGNVFKLDLAYTYHRNPSLDGWQNVAQMKKDIVDIKSQYNKGFFTTLKCVKVGVNDIDFESKINIYPNPTTGIITFETDKNDIESIKVYDILGKLVHSTSISNINFQEKIEIDLSSLSNGIYQVRIGFKDGIVTKKISKTKG
jgi:Secretion system C-terminal sorting domain